ncbi:type IV pilus biogenesis protein PilM [Priestia koreensis]|uniref:Pilus assembly protein PilM n=1 Tax=Priestia koreensis TaxID=284581 RepID=A0A0M0L8K0_9BACI|nr:pilus assembly protein PilM [Priestia koreensis]KOO46963.1 hypothetical protein AMD01_08605 [Priestia koreensis]
MVLSLLSAKNKVGNLVIEDHVIRYVELKQTNPMVVSKKKEHYLPAGLVEEGRIIDPASLSLILDECISDWGIKGTKVRFIVPNSVVVVRTQKLERALAEDEIRSYLYLEMGSSIHLPFENASFDFVVKSQTEEETEIILFAAPELLIQEYVEVLEKSKLKPIAADIAALSLYRLCFYEDRVKPDAHQMLVQFDLFSVNVSIFHQHQPLFARSIPLDFVKSDWSINVNDEETDFHYSEGKEQYLFGLEDVYQEFKRILDFYRFSYQDGEKLINDILLTGEHPFLEEIASHVEERLTIPVDTFSLSASRSQIDTYVQPRYYVPLGLGLKGVL